MNDEGLVFGAGFLFGGLIAIFAITATNNSSWRHESVKHGHAEFYLDANHARQWRWLPPAAQPIGNDLCE